MATCNECRKEFLTGVLSCPECGAFVWGDTIALNPDSGDLESSELVAFVNLNTKRRWVLPLKNDIRIGRADPDKEVWPEIDLSGDNNAVNGVSREHAILRCSEHGPVLLDLDSTNGTVINNFPLSPNQPYLIQDGDRVQFGNLLVKVYLKN
jgi:pSer/pThr/pTyr-binding forkhead associated (FHA) protein